MSRVYINAEARTAYETKKKEAEMIVYNTVDEARNHAQTYIADISESDIMENSLTVDRYCTTADTLEYGSAVASEFNVKLYNKDGRFDDIDFNGKVIRAFLKVSGADTSVITTVPLGVFIVDDVSSDRGIISLKGLDFITVLDKMVGKSYDEFYNSHDDVIINYRELYDEPYGSWAFASGTLGWLLYHVLNDCGFSDMSAGAVGDVQPAPYQWKTAFPNANSIEFIEQEIKDIPNMKNMTYRSILMSICALAGVCAYATDTSIQLVGYNSNDPLWYYDDRFSISETNRYEGTIQKESVQAQGVSLTTPTGGGYYPYIYVTDTSQYIKIKTEISVEGDDEWYVPVSYVSSLYSKIFKEEYYSFEAKILSAPYLYPLDIINYVDGENTYTCLITHVTLSVNGPTYISGKEKPYNDGNTNSDYSWQSSKTGQSFAMLDNRVNELENDHYLYMTDADGLEYKGVIKNINGKPTYVYEEAF
jgi:hypothetical protein